MMDTNLESTQTQYSVVCMNCQNRFDAMSAVWCGCLSSDQTLVCPTCLQCFCKSPKQYIDSFWEFAPQELWDKRIEMQESCLLPRNQDPESVRHPLLLIVDDDTIVLKLAIRAVESLGYSVISARDGLEALSLAKKYNPELILSDMLMPRLDGVQLCRMIKADPATSQIKIVLITSLYTKVRHRVQIPKGSYPDDYLLKPIDFHSVYDLLNKYLPLQGVSQ